MSFFLLHTVLLYNALFLLFLPVIFLLFLWRFYRGKENLNSFLQKFTLKYFFQKKQHYDIWIHGASVGEIKSAEFLIKKNIELGKNVLVTTGTLTSKKIVENYNSKQVTHRFLPLDFLLFYLFFIHKHSVKKVVILESEIWPNLFLVLRILKINTNLLNVDVSRKSQAKWERFGFVLKHLLKTANLILTQNKSTETFMKKYHENVKYFGNVKLLNLTDNYTPKNQKIVNFCQTQKPILTVASTHIGEDEVIIEALKKVCARYKIIYVPRHPERAESIGILLQKNGLSSSMLSNDKNAEDILILNSIGNLMDALHFSQIAIYGGGFLPHLAGHNVLEAGIFKCKVVTGFYVEAFEEIIAELVKNEGIIQVEKNGIYQAILQAEQNEKMGREIYNYILQNKPNLEKIFLELNVV